MTEKTMDRMVVELASNSARVEARADALEKAAKWHDEQADICRANMSNPEADRLRALDDEQVHIQSAEHFRAAKDKP